MKERTILFLDFDDVICLNVTYGGYDVIDALGQVQKEQKSLSDFGDLWEKLFDERAKKNLRLLHDEFNPIYVLSTSWANVMNRAAIAAALRLSGLEFVANNLHDQWETPKGNLETRAYEIQKWIYQNPEFRGYWVILDDEHSGTGLKDWVNPNDEKCLVLCQVDIGLADEEYQLVREAFLERTKP
jgi:hypothetical protein